ncbi:MAG TPA: hypothetical protein VFS65_01550 [Candidatus Saccharimonadales bacterium]|nr:hypothetical protein [Candidatus Saccharimonadales bacterium]
MEMPAQVEKVDRSDILNLDLEAGQRSELAASWSDASPSRIMGFLASRQFKPDELDLDAIL